RIRASRRVRGSRDPDPRRRLAVSRRCRLRGAARAPRGRERVRSAAGARGMSEARTRARRRRLLARAARLLARLPACVPALALAAALVLARSPTSHSQVPLAGGILGGAQSEDEPLFVDANQLDYDRNNDTIRAEGDVVVQHGTSVL